MGPQEAIPEFTPPRWAPVAEARVAIAKAVLPCNWAQILEGAIDSAHSSSLHSSDFVPAHVNTGEATSKNWLRPSTDKAPRLQVERTGYGFRYAALRRPIEDADTKVYVRSSVFVAPSTVLVPPNNLYNVANINVPIDDVNTAFYFIAWGNPATTPETETWRKFLGQQLGVDLDEYYRPLRNRENHFWQDRKAMAAGNFTGITGFPNQDIAMWLTMGPIADRTTERLGASDLAVVELRKRMLAAVRDFQNGKTAIGTGELTVPASVCSFQAIVPKETDWRAFPARYVWEKIPSTNQPAQQSASLQTSTT
jgi:phthalate 4,5-dioxygenase oxygenase subunit